MGLTSMPYEFAPKKEARQKVGPRDETQLPAEIPPQMRNPKDLRTSHTITPYIEFFLDTRGLFELTKFVCRQT